MTNQKSYLVRFIANVGVLGLAEMNAESEEDAKTKTAKFLNTNLTILDVNFDIPSSIENDINLQVKEIDGVTNVNGVLLDGVVDISNPEEAADKALALAMSDEV